MREFTFADRVSAGEVLAKELLRAGYGVDCVVLALPRGGVPVGLPISYILHAPLDVFVVRKLGVPGHEELAMGAVASGGTRVLNDEVMRYVRPSAEQLDAVTRRELAELERRERVFRQGHPRIETASRRCILVDDGLATGSTMRAAVLALRQHDPASITVAVPVAAEEACQQMAAIADNVICLYTPDPFIAVGRWYEDFTQLSDDDVREILDRAAHPLAH